MNNNILIIQNQAVKGSRTATLYVLSFGLLFLIFIGIRLVNINQFSLWGGETFALIGAQMSWPDMLAYMIEDIVHPPLLYILLRIWLVIGGDSLLWLKLLPLLFSIATVVVFLLLCHELNLHIGEISLAFVLISFNGFLAHYAQELRSYIVFWFFSVLSLWMFVRILKGSQKRDLLLFFIINLLMIYTHYYGWFLIGMQFLTVLLVKRLKFKYFIVFVAGWLVLFLPWVLLVYQSYLSKGGLESNLGWIPVPGIKQVAYFYSNLLGQFGSIWSIVVSVALIGFLIGFWVIRFTFISLKSRSVKHLFKLIKDIKPNQRNFLQGDALILWFLSIAILPPLFIFGISYIYPQALWVDRYFIFTTIPFYLGLSLITFRIKPLLLRNIAILLLVTWVGLTGIQNLVTNRVAWESPQIGSRLNWEHIAQRISQEETQMEGPVTIYTVPVYSRGYFSGDWAVMTSLDYYFEKLGETRFDFQYARNLQSINASREDGRFWVAVFQLETESIYSPEDYFEDLSYSVGESIEFQHQRNRFLVIPVTR
jgi:hypothetical protein